MCLGRRCVCGRQATTWRQPALHVQCGLGFLTWQPTHACALGEGVCVGAKPLLGASQPSMYSVGLAFSHGSPRTHVPWAKVCVWAPSHYLAPASPPCTVWAWLSHMAAHARMCLGRRCVCGRQATT